jgi:uncharacterized membrane protein
MTDFSSHEKQESPPYARAAALGVVCGLRSMLGPALVSTLAPAPIKVALRLLSAGEFIADKLPNLPSRIASGPLLGRALSGAAVGYIVCKEKDVQPWLGALVGGAAAVSASYGGYYGRKALHERLHVSDKLIAILEDALAIGLGRRFGP